jgi:hypothetical protein
VRRLECLADKEVYEVFLKYSVNMTSMHANRYSGSPLARTTEYVRANINIHDAPTLVMLIFILHATMYSITEIR